MRAPLAITAIAAGLVGAAVAAAMFATTATSETRRVVPASREVVQYSFSPIVRKAAPAVVNVYVSSRVRAFSSPLRRDPFFDFFFGDRFGQPTDRMQSSLGSGVIVSSNGVIVTNTHVIKQRGETEIRVALADKREFDAKVLSQDDKTDIAILKIEGDGEEFPFLEFEDSDSLEVGDLALAIGNPFGVGQTVTSGIVSALARSQLKSDAVFIQTDAAINPGNSGGALVDIEGKLIGINTAIFSRSGGSNGIGFAIPSNLVRLFVDSAVEGREVERPWLGARLDNVTRDMADALGIGRVAGAVVSRVYNNSPADKGGLAAGDVITRVDGFEVADARGVQYRLTTIGVGSTAELGVIRRGRPVTVKVSVEGAPQPGRGDIRNLSGNHPFDGARVANLLPTIAEELQVDDDEGVAILSVRQRSVAARLGFRQGDVITEVGSSSIKDIAGLEGALSSTPRIWQIAVRRAGRRLELRVPAY